MISKKISYTNTIKELNGKIALPSSKSISNRLLIIQYLCESNFEIKNISCANDTKVLQEAILKINNHSGNEILEIDVKDAGTSFRFLITLLAIESNKTYLIKGTDRLHQRPIRSLVDALKSMKAEIEYMDKENYAPIQIKGKKLYGGFVEIEANESSQFVSALCLVAPMLERGITISLLKKPVSFSYVEMTLSLMRYFGIEVNINENKINIIHQKYIAKNIEVESDWSSASFFYAMAILSETVNLKFENIFSDSIQGDAVIAVISKRWHIDSVFEDNTLFIRKGKQYDSKESSECIDLTHYPDIALPLIVACAIRFPQQTFTGLGHLQHKESDRIKAIGTELSKIGIKICYTKDILSIDNSALIKPNAPILFDTYNDHRIAMSLSMLALAGFTCVLNNGNCVSKSFPGFWNQLKQIGFWVE